VSTIKPKHILRSHRRSPSDSCQWSWSVNCNTLCYYPWIYMLSLFLSFIKLCQCSNRWSWTCTLIKAYAQEHISYTCILKHMCRDSFRAKKQDTFKKF